MKNKYRYLVITMVTFICMINYIDRGAMAYAQQFIIEEYGFNALSWGQVLGFFGYGYIFGGFFGGLLADKKGPKFIWITAAVSWSVLAMTMGIAGEIGIMLFGGSALVGFAIFRILFGFAEGPAFAAVNRTAANWAAPKERGIFNAIGGVGVPLGALITAPVAVFLISAIGWKGMFVVLGAAGIIWALIWTKVFANYPEEHPKVTEAELNMIRSKEGLLDSEKPVGQGKEKVHVPWYHFFKNPTLIFNSIAFFAFNYVNFLMLTWAPKYLQDVFGFQLSSLWYIGMIPWVGACIALPLGGKISDIIREKTNNLRLARVGVCVVSFSLTITFFALILIMNSTAAIIACIALGTASVFLSASLFWTIVIDTAPEEQVGAFSGVTHFIMNCASIIAPTFTGYLVLNYNYTAMFIAAIAVACVGLISSFFIKPGRKMESFPIANPEGNLEI